MSLVNVSLLADTRTCLWDMFHCWLTQEHLSGIVHPCFSQQCNMYQRHVLVSASRGTCSIYMFWCLSPANLACPCTLYDCTCTASKTTSSADTRTCIWYMSLCKPAVVNVSGTCSTACWHPIMSLEHDSLMADTKTCLSYMFECWLAQEYVSDTCSPAGCTRKCLLQVPIHNFYWFCFASLVSVQFCFCFVFTFVKIAVLL